MISYTLSDSFPEVRLFTTTRQSGVSQGNYSSFNLSPFSGDVNSDFQKNIQILSNEIDLPVDKIIIPFQTHETEVKVIDSCFFELHEAAKGKFLFGVDALITNLPGVCIGVTTADCVPVFFYDPNKKVIAVAHAGWRGTCAGIVTKTISKMVLEFGCRPADIFSAIGPSISAKVYKVGEELISEFEKNGFPVDEIFARNESGLFLDLWKANQFLLLKAGIPDANIEISGRCTFTEHETFFSARRLGIKSGRIYSGIFIR